MLQLQPQQLQCKMTVMPSISLTTACIKTVWHFVLSSIICPAMVIRKIYLWRNLIENNILSQDLLYNMSENNNSWFPKKHFQICVKTTHCFARSPSKFDWKWLLLLFHKISFKVVLSETTYAALQDLLFKLERKRHVFSQDQLWYLSARTTMYSKERKRQKFKTWVFANYLEDLAQIEVESWKQV